MRSAALFAICALWASAGWASPTTPDAPQTTRRWALEAAWGEFTLATGVFVLSESEASYQIEGELDSSGLTNWVSSGFTAKLQAQGVWKEGERAPQYYQARSQSERGESFARLQWNAQGAPYALEARPSSPHSRTPIDPDEITPGPDALSFFATVIDNADKGCDATARIWDGVRLYDLQTRTLGAGEAPDDRPWAYAGETLRCRIIYQRLGGFMEQPTRWRSNEQDTLRVLHLAKVSGEWTPVRLELSSPLGSVVARLRLDKDP